MIEPAAEDLRAAQLLAAQASAVEFFAAVETRGLITPGVRETEARNKIRDLAADIVFCDFGPIFEQ